MKKKRFRSPQASRVKTHESVKIDLNKRPESTYHKQVNRVARSELRTLVNQKHLEQFPEGELTERDAGVVGPKGIIFVLRLTHSITRLTFTATVRISPEDRLGAPSVGRQLAEHMSLELNRFIEGSGKKYFKGPDVPHDRITMSHVEDATKYFEETNLHATKPVVTKAFASLDEAPTPPAKKKKTERDLQARCSKCGPTDNKYPEWGPCPHGN
jgi:hypothetical protein